MDRHGHALGRADQLRKNMNNIRNTETGEFGLSVDDVRSWFAQEGRMAMIPDDFVGVLECFESYVVSDHPEHDSTTHKAVQIAPAENDGELTQQWEIVALTADEHSQIEAQQQADAKAAADAARITITKRQALLALFDLRGIKDSDIDAQIDQIPDETQRYRARVDWQGAASIESDSPTVQMLAASLDLSASNLQALFDYAKTL
ncbi:hypothetical protein G7048_15720 [Diaphorobacter sp. HDW4B]|uniref:hypothetical protein n=1 Tax=Diaphorobacter sp. HDW4B TaxID=2714925 RepID=UPI00140E3975|nr:hypothetical protein [Diaphorobacter sp. HDW4B]QIL71676.1 hypothetical protein G7048_15720 [Diaphorobacter sp. HDW4B]